MTYFKSLKRAGLTVAAILFFSVSLFFGRAWAADGNNSAEMAINNNEQKLEQLKTKLDTIQQQQAEILDTVTYLKIRLRKVGR